VAKKSPPHHPP